METYPGSNDSVNKEVGRPIIVYDDSSKQNNKDETSSTSGILNIYKYCNVSWGKFLLLPNLPKNIQFCELLQDHILNVWRRR